MAVASAAIGGGGLPEGIAHAAKAKVKSPSLLLELQRTLGDFQSLLHVLQRHVGDFQSMLQVLQ